MVTAAAIAALVTLGANFVWPTWVSGAGVIGTNIYYEFVYVDTFGANNFYYTGPIKVWCGQSPVYRIEPNQINAAPCLQIRSAGTPFALPSSPWHSCAGPWGDVCATDFLFPAFVIQIKNTEIQAGIARASMVWETPEGLSCVDGTGYPWLPCMEDLNGQVVGSNGPFRGIAIPNTGACIPSEFVIDAFKVAIERNGMCAGIIGTLESMGVEAILVEHGDSYCTTTIPLNEFGECLNDIHSGSGGGGEESELEGENEAESEGEGTEGEEGNSVYNVNWDPSLSACEQEYWEESAYVYFMNLHHVKFKGPVYEGGVLVTGFETTIEKAAMGSFSAGVDGLCWHANITGFPTSQTVCTGALGPYQADCGEQVSSNRKTLVPAGYFAQGYNPNCWPEPHLIAEDCSSANYEQLYHEAQHRVFSSLLVGNDMARLYPKSIIKFVDGVVHKSIFIDRRNAVDESDLSGMPEGGEACTWRSDTGTLLGYRHRAQKTRVPVFMASFLDAGQFYSSEYYWVQYVSYVKSGFKGYRVYIPSVGHSYALASAQECSESNDGPGWYRLYGGLATGQGVASNRSDSLNLQRKPMATPEGWADPSGGGASGGPILNSKGEQVQGLSFDDMRKAMAQGTFVGIGLAENSLASKIADAIASGVANLGGEQYAMGNQGGSGMGNVSFDGSRAGGGGGVDTGKEDLQRGTTAGGVSGELSENTGVASVSGQQTGFMQSLLSPLQADAVAPSFSFTIPWFNDGTETITWDFNNLSPEMASVSEMVRVWFRGLLMLGFLVYAVWRWFIPLFMEGWIAEGKAN